MEKTPAYFRARIAFIQGHLKGKPTDMQTVQLRNGVIPKEFIPYGEATAINSFEQQGVFDNKTPLTFTELTSYSTWFAMHPEKIAGKEEVTTSLHFPITIKGNRETTERTVQSGIDAALVRNTENNGEIPPQQKSSAGTGFQFELELLALELELMDVDGLGMAATEKVAVVGEITTEISKVIRRQPGKIILLFGDWNFGLQKIKRVHGKEIKSMHLSELNFIKNVGYNFSKIMDGGKGRLVVVAELNKSTVAIIELTKGENESADFWSVLSAFPARKKYLKNKKLLWERSAP